MTSRQAARVRMAHRIMRWSKPAVMILVGAALLGALPARAAESVPIKLAIFDFELEDFSAGASPAGESVDEIPSDAEQLRRATDQVRQLFAQSGRYRLVEVSMADPPAAPRHALRDCNGCEASTALKLGADQSLLGVIRRISRTEYMVSIQIRDARTGAILSEEKSGLRLGANYSWSRGAARLIKDRILESGAQQ